MKRPKEPKTFKYPRIYARPEANSDSHVNVSSMIIVYPDGRPAERMYIDIEYILSRDASDDWHIACWNQNRDMTPQRQVDVLKAYARQFGYETIFIGEIK